MLLCIGLACWLGLEGPDSASVPSARVDDSQAAAISQPRDVEGSLRGMTDVGRKFTVSFTFADGQPVVGLELLGGAGDSVCTDDKGNAVLGQSGWIPFRLHSIEGRVDIGKGGETYIVPRISICRLRSSHSIAGLRRVTAWPTTLEMAQGQDPRVRMQLTRTVEWQGPEGAQLALPYGDWRLDMGIPQWRIVPQFIRVDEANESFDLELREFEAQKMGIHVRDETGLPVYGVAVRLQGHKKDLGRTDADGWWEISRRDYPGVEYPMLDIAFDGEQFAPVIGFGPIAWGTHNTVVAVRRRGAAWLLVKDQKGDVIKSGWNARVFATDGGNLEGSASPTQPEPPGRVPLLRGLSESDWVLCQRGESASLAQIGELARRSNSGVDEYDFAWPEEFACQVRVVDQLGGPIAGAAVRLVLACDAESAAQFGPVVERGWSPSSQGSSAAVMVLSAATTDATGRAAVHGPVNAHTFLRVDAASRYLPHVTAVAAKQMEVVLAAAGSLSGLVRGLPSSASREVQFYESPSWRVCAYHGDGSARPRVVSCAIKDGKYQLTGLEHGEHRLLLQRYQQGEVLAWDVGQVHIEGDRSHDMDATRCVRLEMELLVDGLGECAGVTFSLHKIDAAGTSLALQRLTASDGLLRVAIPPGRYQLRASLPAAGVGGRVEVESESPFECEVGASVHIQFVDEPSEVRLVNSDGEPIASQWFVTRASSGYLQAVQSDGRGVLRFEKWPAKRLEVQRATYSRKRGWTPYGTSGVMQRGQSVVAIPD